MFLSHDWPQGIEHHGDLRGLLRRKPYFRDDINKGALGSPPMMGLLRTLQPQWWFSAHLHCRFEATVVHQSEGVQGDAPKSAEKTNPDEINIEDNEDEPTVATEDATATSRNADEIVLDDEETEVEAPPPPPPPPSETKFLALDKCLPKRQFLEVGSLTELALVEYAFARPTLCSPRYCGCRYSCYRFRSSMLTSRRLPPPEFLLPC